MRSPPRKKTQRLAGISRLPIFLLVSLGLHAAVFRAARPREGTTDPVFDPSSQTLAGDTLDVEPAPPAPEEEEPAAAPESPPSPAAPPEPARPPAMPGYHAPTQAPASAGTAAAAAPTRPPLFGAVGVRFATDLATTFTRAFPQAASADPAWTAVPFGASSTSEVTLTLDDDGHLAHVAVGGAAHDPSAAAALRRGIDRTLALLGTGRSFTAHGAVTKIRLTCRVSRDDLHDGLHGDVFALSGGSFSGDVGNAFFALPPAGGPGRRIDVELRLLP
jgi:hypothetical protein